MTNIYGDWIGNRRRRLPHRHRQARQHGLLAAVQPGHRRRRRQGRQEGLLHVRRGLQRRPGDRLRYVPRAACPPPWTSRSRRPPAATPPAAARRRRSPTCTPGTTSTPPGTPTPAGWPPSSATTTWAGSARSSPAARTDPATQLRRDQLAHELMFLTRGQPVVYSGDEQGFTGPGGDKDARQDMFASKTADYLDDDLIGTDRTHARDQYDPRTRSTGPSPPWAGCARPTRRCATASRSPVRRRRPRRLRLLPDRPGPATSTWWRSTTPRPRRLSPWTPGRPAPASPASTAAPAAGGRRRRQAHRDRAATVGGGAPAGKPVARPPPRPPLTLTAPGAAGHPGRGHRPGHRRPAGHRHVRRPGRRRAVDAARLRRPGAVHRAPRPDRPGRRHRGRVQGGGPRRPGPHRHRPRHRHRRHPGPAGASRDWRSCTTSAPTATTPTGACTPGATSTRRTPPSGRRAAVRRRGLLRPVRLGEAQAGRESVGFLVVDKDGNKDVDADRTIDVTQTGEVWVKQGDPTPPTQPPGGHR